MAFVGNYLCFRDQLIDKCVGIYVDVNGFSLPNTIGKDIFGAWIMRDGSLKPFDKITGDTDNCTSSVTGWGCSTYYLTK